MSAENSEEDFCAGDNYNCFILGEAEAILKQNIRHGLNNRDRLKEIKKILSDSDLSDQKRLRYEIELEYCKYENRIVKIYQKYDDPYDYSDDSE